MTTATSNSKGTNTGSLTQNPITDTDIFIEKFIQICPDKWVIYDRVFDQDFDADTDVQNDTIMDFGVIKKLVYKDSPDLEFACAKTLFLKWAQMIGKQPRGNAKELKVIPNLEQNEKVRQLMFGYKRQKLYIDCLQDQISNLNKAFNTLCEKTSNGELSLIYDFSEIQKIENAQEEEAKRLNQFLGIDCKLVINEKLSQDQKDENQLEQMLEQIKPKKKANQTSSQSSQQNIVKTNSKLVKKAQQHQKMKISIQKNAINEIQKPTHSQMSSRSQSESEEKKEEQSPKKKASAKKKDISISPDKGAKKKLENEEDEDEEQDEENESQQSQKASAISKKESARKRDTKALAKETANKNSKSKPAAKAPAAKSKAKKKKRR
eukprot:403337400